MKTLGLMLCVFLVCSFAYAQPKIPVEVIHSGSDSVGGLIAFDLREAVRASHGMQLVTSRLEPTIKIHVVTVDLTPGASQSAVASVIVYDSLDTPQRGALLMANVHVCGRARVGDCAREILATTDAEIVKLQAKSPALWKTLHTR